jgi:hypothetical protein
MPSKSIVFLFIEFNDPLVRTATEREISIAQLLDVRAFNQGIKIRKNHTQTFIRKDFLVGESGVTPDGLACLFLDAA